MTFDEKLAQALDNSAKARAEQMITVKKKASLLTCVQALGTQNAK